MSETPNLIEQRINQHRIWQERMLLKYTDNDQIMLLTGPSCTILTVDYCTDAPIKYGNFEFSCIEVAYKFCKYGDASWGSIPDYLPPKQLKFLRACLDKAATGKSIRLLENRLNPIENLNPKWSDTEYKKQLMLDISRVKFAIDQQARAALLQTGTKQIIAPSYKYDSNGLAWSDQIFEIEFDDNLKPIGGQNVQGEILMTVRREISNSRYIYLGL
jgi:hypothetical protein